ncbi:MAG: phosphoribosyltransferase [Schleiferiaceae bacterium]|nr:phosphoribosyltransferase [Schleiferiaceae bacterium]
MSNKTEILDAAAIEDKIQRLAWELYDRHHNATDLHVVGIKENGFWLAEQLVERLRKISDITITLHPLVLDKAVPVLEDMVIDLPVGGEFALVDDVLNSGRTLLWAVIKLMSYRPRVLSTTVLVDRSHKRYPVKADLKGLSLSTTLLDSVRLNIVDGEAVNVQLV